MSLAFAPPILHPPAPARSDPGSIVVVDAARCWRCARDGGKPVQRMLYRLLVRGGFEQLAPVFDSLFTLYEAGLGRRFEAGGAAPGALTCDEHRLLELLDCSRCAERVRSNRPVRDLAPAMRIALRSTLIMMRLAVGEDWCESRLAGSRPNLLRRALLS